MLQAENGDLESMDSEVVLQEENYLEESLEEFLLQEGASAETAVNEALENAQMAENTENQISESEVPGEAVFTNAT